MAWLTLPNQGRGTMKITVTYEGAVLTEDAAAKILNEYNRLIGEMRNVLAIGALRARGKRPLEKESAMEFRFRRERVTGEFAAIHKLVKSVFPYETFVAIQETMNPEGFDGE